MKGSFRMRSSALSEAAARFAPRLRLGPLAVGLMVAGCRNGAPATGQAGTSTPRYGNARVQVAHRHGAVCTGGLGATGRLVCGPGSGPTELTWGFVSTSPAGDVYRVSRNFQVKTTAAATGDGAVATVTSESGQMIFKGQPMAVCESPTEAVRIFPEGLEPVPFREESRAD